MRVVRGTVVHGYSRNDYILHLFRISVGKIAIGRRPLMDVEGETGKLSNSQKKKKEKLLKCREGIRIINYDLTKIAGGHLDYRDKLENILKAIHFVG